MKRTLYPLLLLAFIFSSFGAHGQSTQLVYKTKGKNSARVNITLSTDMGNTSLSPEEFQKSENLYFTITLVSATKTNFFSGRKDYFRESDISDYFSKIAIYQDGQRIKQNKAPSSFSDEKGHLNRVIISFSKENVKLYEPFSFVNNIGGSSKIKIEETFLPSYAPYQNLFVQAKSMLQSNLYTEAFKTVSKIGNDAKNNPEIRTLSFYQDAMQNLAAQAVRKYVDSISNVFSQKQKLFAEEKTKPSLDACDSVLKAFDQQASLFQPYLQSSIPGIEKLKAYFNKVNTDMNNGYQASRLAFKKANMALLENSNYSEYKFYLFVDVLSRMLCQTDSFQIIHGLRPIDLKTLNYLPKKKEELTNTGWMKEFKTLVGFLNDNIREKKVIFDNPVMSNLKQQAGLEHQPYYQIFTAFNSLNDNPAKFYTSLNDALVQCSDSTLLNDIDMWLVSYKMTQEGIDPESVDGINKGIAAIESGQWDDANNIFDILKRQANQNPVPWFYSAMILYHQHEIFSAQAQFARALELYPHYLAPRQFIFRILASQKQYQNLLEQADTAISSFNIWFFHYAKAWALLDLNKTSLAINEIQTNCVTMNPWDTKQYFLLGDAYLKMNDFKNARSAYMKTRDIDPFSDSKEFNNKMKALIKQEQNYQQQQIKRQQEQKIQEQEQNKKQSQEIKTGKDTIQTGKDTTKTHQDTTKNAGSGS